MVVGTEAHSKDMAYGQEEVVDTDYGWLEPDLDWGEGSDTVVEVDSGPACVSIRIQGLA